MEIYYTPLFLRAFKKLSKDIQIKTLEKEKILKEQGLSPSLKIHKLHGELSDVWSLSITYSYRIIINIASNKEIHFLTIGNHDVYK